MAAALKLSSCRGLCSIPMAPGARIQLTAGVCQRYTPRAGTQVLDIALVVPETGEATDVSGCTGIGQVRYELGQMQGEGNSEATSHSFSWGWGLWGCVVLLCHVPPENRSHTVTPAPGGKGDMESSSSYHTSKKCPVNLWDDGHLGVVAQTLHEEWLTVTGRSILLPWRAASGVIKSHRVPRRPHPGYQSSPVASMETGNAVLRHVL